MLGTPEAILEDQLLHITSNLSHTHTALQENITFLQ